jgi:hypothetical protein
VAKFEENVYCRHYIITTLLIHWRCIINGLRADMVVIRHSLRVLDA